MKTYISLLSVIALLISMLSMIGALPVLAVEGVSGDFMYEVNEDGVTVTDYTGSDTVVEIPPVLGSNLVTAIGNNVFEEHTDLQSIMIPATVTHIGTNAFYNCYALEIVYYGGDSAQWAEVTIDSGNENLEWWATIYCDVAAVGSEGDFEYYLKRNGDAVVTAYYGDDAEVVIPDKLGKCAVTEIGAGAFRGNFEMTSITIPSSVKVIGDSAFWCCFALASVTIPDGVETIAYGTFYGCDSLESVIIPDSVRTIENEAFGGCESLTSFVIPDQVTSIGEYVFSDCTKLSSLTIPDSVTSVGDSIISNTPLAEDASLWEDGGLYIDRCLIEVDETVTDFVVKSGTRVTACSAFYDCSNLVSLTLPATLTAVGNYAFNNCDALESVYFDGTADEWIRIEFGYYANPMTQAQALYFDGELVTEVVLSEGVTSIGYNAFYNCRQLTSITIPDSVTTIGVDAFEGCEALVDVYYEGTADEWVGITFEDGWYYLLDIAENLYFEGELVTDAVLTDGVTAINAYAFYSYEQLKTITIPSSVKVIGDEAFYYCFALETVYYCGSQAQWEAIEIGDGGLDLEYVQIVFDYYENGPAISSNVDRHYYADWWCYDDPITSTLVEENGGYMRVEYIGEGIVAEYYDEAFQFLSRKEIPLELPLYGGVYIADDYNFVVVGQENLQENDDVEVYRVIRYSKDWEREASAGIFGANTTVPFDAGTLRMDRCGDMLYVHTCHEMYASDDGLNHQANMRLCVNVRDMSVTNLRGSGYVSHSFNQFVRVDGDTLLTVDHGDAYPRAVCITKYAVKASEPPLYEHARGTMINVLPIAESTCHYNDTGVSVGGFEASSTHYLVAGSTADQSMPSTLCYDDNQRNIFVTATPKDNFTEAGTTILYLTNYAEGAGVDVSPPHLVKISDERFCLIWTEDGVLKYGYLGADGRLVGNIVTAEGALSDCHPIVSGNRIVWYVTDGSMPCFYQIDIGSDSTTDGVVTARPTAPIGTSATATTTTTTAVSTTTTVGAQSPFKGDLNGDGKVTIADAVTLYYYVNGKASLADESIADMNDDGNVNIADAVTLYYYVNGKIDSL